jgi:hypothetical protein
MLGRKSFTQDELDAARSAVAELLATYRALTTGLPASADTAREAFEAPFFATATLALDRRFVHRLRMVTGKDGTPLNEVEMIVDSLMNNGGVLRDSTAIKYVPEQSVVKLKIGDPVRLTADDFERLSAAVLDEIERKFL